jgi:hypothetical protein
MQAGVILFGLSAKILDVETAFLYGKLEEEVYMENPEGLEDSNDDEALLLLTTIYGLVQAARQYYKKARGEHPRNEHFYMMCHRPLFYFDR